MRVLRISHSAVVDEWRERERAIARRGVDLHLISAKRWNEGGREVALQARRGERVLGVGTLGSHPALFLYDPFALWRALGGQWDVLDIHEEPFALATAEILLIRALRRQRARYVLYSAQNIDKRYPIPFRWFERLALRSASQLSVCNDEAGRIAARKGFCGEPDTIPLGIDTTQYVAAEDARPSSSARHQVGYVGRLAPHKGVDVLLEAVAADDGLALRIVGGGPAERALRSRAVELGVTDRVEFTGFVGHDALPGVYRGFDVLGIPSLPTPGWLEQFGRVAIEAMASGVPVVASDSGALPDVVGGAGLLVPPGDPVALREALLSVVTDEPRASSMVAAGFERARSCTWESVADRYLALYQRVNHTTTPVELGSRGPEVIVVAYGSPAMLNDALAPLAAVFPVTVVDNSSMVEIQRVCERLGARYIDPGRNGGFAAGVNAGLIDRALPGADVLLLNPDAVVTPPNVEELHRALLADPACASVGPTQVDGSGSPCRVGWPFPSPLATWLGAVGLGRLGDRTDFVIGSVLLLRAEALEQVGMLDERFFLYAEETDWALRASRLGWRHAVVPTAVAAHLGGATSTDRGRRETHFHASQERYLRKHYGALGWHAARVGQLIGSGARSVVTSGERRAAAMRRFTLYLRGPMRAERALTAQPGPAGAA